ncbi:MAG: hypothetical protein ACK4OM_02905 [Alphaproteobacteria bacterium]
MNNTQNKTIVIYITARPGTGKYTIAKALAKDYGFRICDNQLINNPILELLNYDGFTEVPEFAWVSIRKIRSAVWEFIANEKNNSYILTNNLFEYEGDRKLYEQVKQIALGRGSLFIPVRLTITEEEHLKRVTQPERRKRWKSIDPKEVYNEMPLLQIHDPELLNLEVTNLSPEEAAEQIVEHVKSFNYNISDLHFVK